MPESFDDQFDDQSADLLTIEDEDGNLHEYEIVDQIDVDDERYVALIAALDDEDDDFDDEQGELVILRSEMIEDEEFLSAIEDEDEFDKIAAIFMEHLAEEFEIEE